MNAPYTFISNLALETGELLRGFFERTGGQTSFKADRTLLTEADLASDRHLTAAIRGAFPGDHILSEERDTTFPADNRPVWVIDPLDGTTNFSRGLHHWGVSIARLVDGRPQMAALSFPLIGERYTARAGHGATLNGRPLKVPPADAHPVSFFLCDSRLNQRYTTTIRYKPRILGSAAYNFCGIAKGIGLVGVESIPKIWDIAASWLVLEEAGGAIRSLKGDIFPLEAGADYSGRRLPVIGAADAELLTAAHQKIKWVEEPAPR